MKLSEIFQAVEISSLLKDNNIKVALSYIKNVIINDEVPQFVPDYPRHERFSSIFSLSMGQIYTLHLC